MSEFAARVQAPSRDVEALWSYDVEILSQLTLGDDWVAVAADIGRRRHDVVLDATTGERLWSSPSSTSAILSGFGPSPPLVIGDTFIHLETARGDRYVTIVALDVRSGDEIWRFERSAFLTAQPSECDNGNICGTGFWDATTRQKFEIDIKTGALISSVDGGLDLTGGIELRRQDPPERFTRSAIDGTELWTVDLDTAFDNDVETALGWSTDLVDDDLFIAYVPDAEFDFDTASVVALDYETGDLRWRREGRTLSCSEPIETDDFHVWCAETGGYEITRDDGEVQFAGSTEINTTVEVFDPATGATIGALDIGSSPAWDGVGIPDRPLRSWQLDGALAARSSDGLVAIDFATGETVTLPDGQLAWCAVLPTGGDAETSTGSFLGYEPCVVGDLERNAVDTSIQPGSVLPAAGGTIGDIVVIVRDATVQAYQLTATD